MPLRRQSECAFQRLYEPAGRPGGHEIIAPRTGWPAATDGKGNPVTLHSCNLWMS